MSASLPHSETTAGRKALAAKGRALPPAGPGQAPGYPVGDADHWDKARQSIGRVKNPARRAQVAKLLRKTAPMVGRTQALGQSWAAPAGVSMANEAAGQIGYGLGWINGRYGNANPDLGIYLAADGDAPKPSGGLLKCPACGHEGTGAAFGASGASQDRQPGDLRTPARSTGAVRDGAPLTVRAGAAHALAGETRRAVELARAGTLTGRRHPVSSPVDVIVARGEDGQAVIRHRQGGATIAAIRRNDDGSWQATVDGRDLAPHAHQRTALMEAVGTYNKALTGPLRPATAPLQPPPSQTPLMAEYGIPAIRALATPVTGAGAGPRVTMAGPGGGPGGDDTDEDGLTSHGKTIRDRLKKKGFPHERATQFAKRSQNMKPGQFGKAAS